jgi:hypothetical protein
MDTIMAEKIETYFRRKLETITRKSKMATIMAIITEMAIFLLFWVFFFFFFFCQQGARVSDGAKVLSKVSPS